MGMRPLKRGQWTPCGSGGGGDCIKVEVADAARGDLIIGDTDDTFRGKIQGHELWMLVSALSRGDAPADIMQVIEDDCDRYAAEMADAVAACPLPKRVPSADRATVPDREAPEDDLTAGRHNVERVFYYLVSALRVGIDPLRVAALYDTYAGQLDQHPRTSSKRLCRELLDMIEGAGETDSVFQPGEGPVSSQELVSRLETLS